MIGRAEDWIVLAGGVATIYGIALLNVPAALIVGGAGLLYIGTMMGRARRAKETLRDGPG